MHIKDGKYGPNLRIGPSQPANRLLTERSFRWRASKEWNKLPTQLRHSKSIEIFKRSLKAWIKTNVPVKAGDIM